ncbi:MAG: ATP-binding cassette domain-containing protein [Actinomycetota bacterium]
MASVISVRDLSMTYKAPVREHGMKGSLKALFKRTFREVHAVKDVTFDVAENEIVAFIGPNGAGKTTTLKMLSGVLHPTGGDAHVLGHVPWKREASLLKQIALIRGSKPFELFGELTVMDVLRFQRLIYEVPEADFKRDVAELTELLDLEPLKRRQVRALSLGERMRVGFANALVYRPKVLFLDEPTIGLDVSASAAVRQYVRDYCATTGATVMLTSHAMGDVESLCKRVILIDQGTLRYDGDLQGLATRLAPWKLLRVAVSDGATPDWSAYGEVVGFEEGHAQIRVPRDQAAIVTARMLAEVPVHDLAVEDPPLESVIDLVYRAGGVGVSPTAGGVGVSPTEGVE